MVVIPADISQSAPSRATIQQELMGAEIGDHFIRGQTSWISSGMKIQEIQYVLEYTSYVIINLCIRLAIRYQLRTQGSQITVEDAQILENKQVRLQKLIDMFAHQSDAFILNHAFAEEGFLMASLGDYSEYDGADDIDESGVPKPSEPAQSRQCHGYYVTDGSGINAKDVPLLLPSSLGWHWCVGHGHKALAKKEATLRYAQATDAIHRIRLALGFKSALFQTHVRHARTQKTKSRAWTAVHTVDAAVHDHARMYSMARDAYNKIMDPSEESPTLPLLQVTDLRVNTSIIGAAELGQRNKQLPWIWSFGTSTNQDGTWLDDCECLPVPNIWFILRDDILVDRVHWLRAKAQFERWKEEQDSVHNEAIWVPAYFHAKAEQWSDKRNIAIQEQLPGHAAYASRQAHAWEELSRSSTKALSPITYAPLKFV